VKVKVGDFVRVLPPFDVAFPGTYQVAGVRALTEDDQIKGHQLMVPAAREDQGKRLRGENVPLRAYGARDEILEQYELVAPEQEAAGLSINVHEVYVEKVA
jgi:hypothetical protein